MKAGLFFLALGTLMAQVPNPTQQKALTPAETGQPTPIFRVTVVARTTKAVNYHHRTGSTHIDFRGTELMPTARGEAKVASQMGSTKIETALEHMSPASQYGSEYMTYVMWGVTPEGRAVNLGEVVLDGDHAKLLSTTELQTFGLIVTAEPYFAVTQPSDVVVAENFIRNDTSGTIEQVDANYHLLQRGQYVWNRTQYQPIRVNPKGPLQLGEAENAVEIARLAGADKYAAETFQKAMIDLRNAEGFLNGSGNRKESETNAREAAQMAEDARMTTVAQLEKLLAQGNSSPIQHVFPTWPQHWLVTALRLAIYYSLAWPATYLLAAPRIRGRENLRALHGPALVISNHVTYLDIAWILPALPARFRNRLATAMGGERLARMRRPSNSVNFFQYFLERLRYFLALSLFNVFPLPQQSGFLRSFSFAGDLADRQWNIMVFPEGKTTEDGNMSPFRSGIGLLVKQLNVPVVPIYLHGLFDLKQSEQIFARPGRVQATIGAPVRFSPGQNANEITRELERLVRELQSV